MVLSKAILYEVNKQRNDYSKHFPEIIGFILRPLDFSLGKVSQNPFLLR